MWWLIPAIIGAFVALIVIILFLKVNINIVYSDDLFSDVRILFFRYPLYPEPPEKIDPKDFSIKNLRKRKKQLHNKQKEQPKMKPAHKGKSAKEEVNKILDYLRALYLLLKYVASPLGKHLRVRISRLDIAIGGDDAADIAVTYGMVTQAISYVLGWVDHVTNLKVDRQNSINVRPDYVSTEIKADIKIVLVFRVWQIISLLAQFVFKYTADMAQKEQDK